MTKPTYQLTLRANDDRTDPDGHRQLKLILKRLLRTYGFRAIRVEAIRTEQVSIDDVKGERGE